jgi:hypothetical protein
MINTKRAIEVVAILMITALPDVGAQELDGRRLSQDIKQEFLSHSARTVHDTHVTPEVAPTSAQTGTNACEVLHWDRESYNKPYMSIERPGKYCLDQDYEFACSIFGHSCGGRMIEISASNVDLDFRGHTLRMSGTRGYTGVRGYGKNIRVHNGRIQGAGLAITLMNRGASPGNAYPVLQVDTDDVFTETGFVVERMQFDDVVSAVAVAGSGNQIRDNVIDASLEAKATSGPPFAVLSYGPSARIERNTFRLHDLTPGSNGYAIYLRSADGTVVEGNTVRVDDTPTGTIGVGLGNSRDVSLRRNRIDTEKSTELDERSSLQPANSNGTGRKDEQ